MLTLAQACEALSISTATGRNWIKLGKIKPTQYKGKKPYFAKQYIKEIQENLKSNQKNVLKSRRNKKFVSGMALYQSYISDSSGNLENVSKILVLMSAMEKEPSISEISYIIADCAIKMLHISGYEQSDSLEAYLKERKSNFLLDDLIDDSKKALYFIRKNKEIFSYKFIYEKNEDILGLLYISLKNMGERKAAGVYYTPTKIVKQLIDKLPKRKGIDYFDPCCGTGNFLLNLPSHIPVEKIYGNDIDSISIKITRLNMAIKYNCFDKKLLFEHFTVQNYLCSENRKKYQVIIGNPPWGYEFNRDELSMLKQKFQTADGKNVESYDVFLEHAMLQLATGGTLSFVLPEAVLNVKMHEPVRRFIMEHGSITYLNYLGNVFDGVNCPGIILQISTKKCYMDTAGMQVQTPLDNFVIYNSRSISEDCFNFNINDKEYEIIQKLEAVWPMQKLKDQSQFALGIVTGDNGKFVTHSPESDNEIILKGTDIRRYGIIKSNNYIKYVPENFQQTAHTKFYRAKEKLLYRFICSQLVFAYDNEQHLSLNSCNILIPEIENVDIKYIMAILNSQIMQFYFEKKYNSCKVLKSHIENFPIAIASEKKQTEIIEYAEILIRTSAVLEKERIYNKLDKEIADVYNLDYDEYSIIKASQRGKLCL